MTEDGRPLEGVVIALDVDGVLLDAERGGDGPWQLVVAERFGLDPDELHRGFFETWWSDVIVGRVAIEDALASAITESDWPVTVDALLDCWFESDFCPDTQVIAAANTWHAQGARLVLATNQEHRRARYVRENLTPLIPVDTMVYSAAIGHVKREPQFFVTATRALRGGAGGGTPIVFLDDTAEHVMVAERAGWVAVHFEPGSWSERMAEALAAAAR